MPISAPPGRTLQGQGKGKGGGKGTRRRAGGKGQRKGRDDGGAGLAQIPTAQPPRRSPHGAALPQPHPQPQPQPHPKPGLSPQPTPTPTPTNLSQVRAKARMRGGPKIQRRTVELERLHASQDQDRWFRTSCRILPSGSGVCGGSENEESKVRAGREQNSVRAGHAHSGRRRRWASPTGQTPAPPSRGRAERPPRCTRRRSGTKTAPMSRRTGSGPGP